MASASDLCCNSLSFLQGGLRSSLLSVLVIRGRSCRIGGSIRARGGSVIPLPLITTGGVRTVARCRSRTTSYVGRQYRQAAVLDFNYGSPARHGAESGGSDLFALCDALHCWVCEYGLTVKAD